MSVYIVKLSTIRHNGTRYLPGSEIELSPAEAKRLKIYLSPVPKIVKQIVPPRAALVIKPPLKDDLVPPDGDEFPKNPEINTENN